MYVCNTSTETVCEEMFSSVVSSGSTSTAQRGHLQNIIIIDWTLTLAISVSRVFNVDTSLSGLCNEY